MIRDYRTITRIERLKNTRVGNPRYRLWFGNGGPYETTANLSDAFMIGYDGYRVGDHVFITMNAARRIRSIESAKDW